MDVDSAWTDGDILPSQSKNVKIYLRDGLCIRDDVEDLKGLHIVRINGSAYVQSV